MDSSTVDTENWYLTMCVKLTIDLAIILLCPQPLNVMPLIIANCIELKLRFPVLMQGT